MQAERRTWDVFISYASEDSQLVESLAKALRDRHVRVWYDQFELKLGDRLLESIDRGLSESRYGIIVLSPNFFRKRWPQYELDALLQKEQAGEKVILPVWHQVTVDDVRAHSPILAGRVAANTSDGLQELVTKICRVIEPDVTKTTELAAMLEPLTEEEKIKTLLEGLGRFTDPDSYRSYIGECNSVVQRLMEIASRFASLGDYFQSYVELLGFPPDRGTELMTKWIKDLEDDPWWEQKTMATKNYLATIRPPSPETILECAFKEGDSVTVLWICNEAYRSSLATKNRENFLSILKEQTDDVQFGVFKGWVRKITSSEGGNYLKVAENPTEAFKILQRLQHIAWRWSAS